MLHGWHERPMVLQTFVMQNARWAQDWLRDPDKADKAVVAVCLCNVRASWKRGG